MEKKINIPLKIVVIIIMILVLIVILGITVGRKLIHSKDNQDINEIIEEGEKMTVVPTMQEKISNDTSWCGTFQLVWNDMKNEVIKKDIVFNPQEKVVENLNKEEFTKDMISENYYYKKYGMKSLKLKEEIEKGIKEKFNQTSDILNDFDWTENGLANDNIERYFFYVMLYRKFEFLKEFNKLEIGRFANKYDGIKYFGINSKTDKEVRKQIHVLYYNSRDDFAIKIDTKTDDEVIFCKNPRGTTFKEIYDNMNTEENRYKGSKSFGNKDEFKAPNLAFNEKKEYKELEEKTFLRYDGAECDIAKAIQSIKFTLDEKGGEIKSEAAIDMRVKAIAVDDDEGEPRYFYVDDTFAIFLRENGKELPYFAAKINDITKFQ